MNVPPTKESGKPVMHHYKSDSLVDFSRAEHDPDCPGCEIERLREALEKLANGVPSVRLSLRLSYEEWARGIAHDALDHRP